MESSLSFPDTIDLLASLEDLHTKMQLSVSTDFTLEFLAEYYRGMCSKIVSISGSRQFGGIIHFSDCRFVEDSCYDQLDFLYLQKNNALRTFIYHYIEKIAVQLGKLSDIHL